MNMTIPSMHEIDPQPLQELQRVKIVDTMVGQLMTATPQFCDLQIPHDYSTAVKYQLVANRLAQGDLMGFMYLRDIRAWAKRWLADTNNGSIPTLMFQAINRLSSRSAHLTAWCIENGILIQGR